MDAGPAAGDLAGVSVGGSGVGGRSRHIAKCPTCDGANGPDVVDHLEYLTTRVDRLGDATLQVVHTLEQLVSFANRTDATLQRLRALVGESIPSAIKGLAALKVGLIEADAAAARRAEDC